jgi:hypothetical protein
VNYTQRRVGLAVLAAALVAPVLHAGEAAAQPGRSMAIQTTIDVVADGLNTPRGVIWDASQARVLVAEAGLGGPSAPNGGTCGHANGGALYCYGATGSVFQFTEYSTPKRIATGLASIANYSSSTGVRGSVLGLHDLSLAGGQLTGVFGLSGRQLPFRDTELVAAGATGAAALGQAAVIDGGLTTPYGDLARYEEEHNPLTPVVDSDPYGMFTDASGTIVADAAGNDVLRIRPDGGMDVLAVFPVRVPAANPSDTVESVPTAVTRGPDGAYYVSELSGFPYYKGEAKVWRLAPGQAPTVFAEGFTNIADLTFDDHGRLVVLEMSAEGLYAGRGAFGQPHSGDTATGRLVRIEHNGNQTELARDGLSNPGGVAYVGTAAGYSLFYVTNRTTSADGSGQLLRLVVRG